MNIRLVADIPDNFVILETKKKMKKWVENWVDSKKQQETIFFLDKKVIFKLTGVLKMWWRATVSSTTPKLEPRWPPVFATVWIRSANRKNGEKIKNLISLSLSQIAIFFFSSSLQQWMSALKIGSLLSGGARTKKERKKERKHQRRFPSSKKNQIKFEIFLLTSSQFFAQLLQLPWVEVLNVHREVNSVQKRGGRALLFPVGKLVAWNGVPRLLTLSSYSKSAALCSETCMEHSGSDCSATEAM